ncbi:YtfJ family protein [Prodigiosinella confusarubida]|uniref:YtfJ family protein n=1 Tax=Serratia sp. (strain ATCC 39006) TaxID=104623 RepID=A0A2I5T4V9_SERS3|nr:YtfJ family protein [Serratia sp. ATCC 39006]AUG99609.1 YtfJ family protein [Serratia sp. ATCC 39006]AUH03927.1 YtfJ family protein [Serratia sp. ATCC 39006]
MTRMTCLFVALVFIPFLTSAHSFAINQPVPSVGVVEKGELNYQNEKFSYQNWSSAQLNGKVRVILHVAGRISARNMNNPLITTLREANLPREYYQTTTIVNVDDAVIGTGMFVRGRVKDSKQANPWSQFVIDSNGDACRAWELTPKSSAIVVLDAQGKVRFVKDGALNRQEIQQVVSLLHTLLHQEESHHDTGTLPVIKTVKHEIRD